MIYFIRAKKFLKIGYSKDPIKRISELQTGNPVKLKLIGVLPGTYETEKMIHRVLSKFRVEGEWFKVQGKVESLVHAFSDKNNIHQIKDFKSLERAAIHLQLRKKNNRYKKKKSVSNRSKRIKEVIGS